MLLLLFGVVERKGWDGRKELVVVAEEVLGYVWLFLGEKKGKWWGGLVLEAW
jgi:hypothetical protein